MDKAASVAENHVLQSALSVAITEKVRNPNHSKGSIGSCQCCTSPRCLIVVAQHVPDRHT
jgi:hypothetical protein